MTLGHSFVPRGIPFLRAEDITGSAVDPERVTFKISEETDKVLCRSRLQPGDLLITIAGTLGRIGYVPMNAGPLNCNQAVAFVRLKPDVVDLHYATFACQAQIENLLRVQKIGTIGNLNLEQVRQFRIPLPGIDEQKRIVAFLKKADWLRRTRCYALDLTDTLLPAAFIDLFGEDADQFPAPVVEELAAKKPHAIRTGPFGSQLLHSEFTDKGIAVLGIDNAVNNEFAWVQRRYITPEKYEQLKRYTVFPGDVIITIMGTCGRCAIVPNNIPTAINTKHLCCITFDQTRCLPTYLHGAFLFHPFVRHQQRIATKGAIMDGLNMEIIKGLRIPLPPLSLQEKFAKIVQRVARLRAVEQEALRQAEHLFASLLDRAFGDQLC
jgi:type I restriction enzyme S subunit